MYVEFTILCNNCGGKLGGTQIGDDIYIDPCRTCVEKLENTNQDLVNEIKELKDELFNLRNELVLLGGNE